ncbi:hypothetical protein L3X38_032111 [Prunus dulcis]|uniref:Peptidase A1 domain-containing protein n=1 Tax=Prunus dulcis TaxID=3755 RepID=A0AAD4VDE3_PRUDU|nr:hypothetical protein L3X38_032111 [Prunus dulcis]
MASSSSSSSSSLLLSLSLLLLLPYITSSNIITIPISHLPKNPHTDPYQHLSYLANSSLKRAHHLKNPQTTPPHTNTKIPLFSQSYGEYSIPLSFGTPPQTLPFIMDTGSDLIWFPCSKKYQCINCSTYHNNTIANSVRKTVPGDALGTHTLTALATQVEVYSLKRCTYRTDAYPISLWAAPFALPTNPSGIAGLGRGPASLPAQLAVKKFSYCLLFRLFDDTNKSSSLVLVGGKDSVKKTKGVSYTPFVKIPEVRGKRAFLTHHYYVGLHCSTVGGRHVKIPYSWLTLPHYKWYQSSSFSTGVRGSEKSVGATVTGE